MPGWMLGVFFLEYFLSSVVLVFLNVYRSLVVISGISMLEFLGWSRVKATPVTAACFSNGWGASRDLWTAECDTIQCSHLGGSCPSRVLSDTQGTALCLWSRRYAPCFTGVLPAPPACHLLRGLLGGRDGGKQNRVAELPPHTTIQGCPESSSTACVHNP